MSGIDRKILCHRPWSGFEIYDHLGDVRPCCWGKVSCGNINSSLPSEIWNGTGFQHYRQQMLEGRTESICSPSCPILNGHYKETLPEKVDQHTSPASYRPDFGTAPSFLRVVPTTRCNLSCKMCYQLGDPPPTLPQDLFQLLAPWIETACEFQILGGEPFIAPECLEWIRRLSPVKYPHLRLCAITNGLGFTGPVCQLIEERRWSWILVSIDASSTGAYQKVRGGDFASLIRGLEKLTESRSRAEIPFEIRFGFTLQKSNLNDAVPFLDLCAEHGAVPQFSLVFGDWHGESPANGGEVNRFISTLEEVDKVLCVRGFTNRIVAGAIAALNLRAQQLEPVRPTFMIASEARNTALNGCSVAPDQLYTTLTMLDGKPVLTCPNKPGELGPTHVVIRLGKWTESQLTEAQTALSERSLKSFSFQIPYFEGGNALSALQVWRLVEILTNYGNSKGWKHIGGHPDPVELGLNPEDQEPRHEVLHSKSIKQPVAVSIVSAMNNCSSYLDTFLRSLDDQLFDELFELVLVDDNSTDDSLRIALEIFPSLSRISSLKLLKTMRTTKYVKGTFTFGAGLAREVGLRNATGSRILFLDPDQSVDPHCVREHWNWGERGFSVVIGDRIESTLDLESSWNRLRREALNRHHDWWLSFFTGNSSVARQLLLDVGGFDCTLQYWGLDDTDLAYRLQTAGASVWHTPRARVLHINQQGSGGGTTHEERLQNFRLHMEVLYRKYLKPEILRAFRFAWPRNMEHLNRAA